ncbi:MAG: CinA family nicotinamide mononucleotide deamidase-related protein [Candidatus Electrothrix aestuarii]|uniref:CinA-like protein n=1 Tax=Candidatus Electrothrix aestuarii TaxID=3062594 RepID=A0AAU8M1C7_9BACT|nr:MAG: CinA family nicotinamide mononucleotide deamidase-related protein [Candidatus Electrothrix sp. GW3-3]
MIGEIIAIGDELTSGRITNTTSAFAARELFQAGHEIYAMHTIGDTSKLIGEALKRAIRRVDFVIVTGGLGPTTDDLTNEAVAEALQRPSTLNEAILEKIRSQLQNTDGQLDALEKLAWLPAGSEVLSSKERMAGHLLVHDDIPIFFLPGVPIQAQKLLVDVVLPRLAGWSGCNKYQRMRLYKTVGLPEHEINKRLMPLEQEKKVAVGYYPVDFEVHVSLTVSSSNAKDVETLFHNAEQQIQEALGDHIYGTDRETLAEVVGNLLKEKRLMLSIAESCTGGLICSQLTTVPGSSEWFAGGVVAYSNHLKEVLLNVDRDLLRNYGAVSKQVAIAMAARLAARVGTKVSLSITGIAGPGGGTEEKPVGTVYIGIFYKEKVKEVLHHFSGGRKEIQALTAQTALDMVRRVLLADNL